MKCSLYKLVNQGGRVPKGCCGLVPTCAIPVVDILQAVFWNNRPTSSSKSSTLQEPPLERGNKLEFETEVRYRKKGTADIADAQEDAEQAEEVLGPYERPV